jgi:hypothetical protein
VPKRNAKVKGSAEEKARKKTADKRAAAAHEGGPLCACLSRW